MHFRRVTLLSIRKPGRSHAPHGIVYKKRHQDTAGPAAASGYRPSGFPVDVCIVRLPAGISDQRRENTIPQSLSIKRIACFRPIHHKRHVCVNIHRTNKTPTPKPPIHTIVSLAFNIFNIEWVCMSMCGVRIRDVAVW